MSTAASHGRRVPTHLPPCPECSNGEWKTRSGGDSVEDPYPHE